VLVPLGQVSIVSHSYRTYFSFPGSDFNLDCGLRDHEVRISNMILTWTLTCIFLHNAFRPAPLLWSALYQVLLFPFYSLSLVRCFGNWPHFIFVAYPLSCF
jgi:hypothetical protein